MKTIYALLSVLYISALSLQAQNLILNPGCDDTLVEGEIPGWSEIIGDEWTQRLENPVPYSGLNYFFAGAVVLGELGQVIDISDDSTEIDNGTKFYYFTGYVRAFSQSPPDESNIFIHFRNYDDTLLASYYLGPYSQTQIWLRIDTTMSAPPGARKIDIRLHSVRHNGSNNDGYFDELYLGNYPLVGMPDVDKNKNLLIYPNPSKDIIIISSPKEVILDVAVIYNQTGQKVLQSKPVNNTLDISKLKPGMYIIELVTDQGKMREKLIVE